jgi:hypothetical protein
VKTVIGLSIPDDEILTMSDEDLKKLAEQAISQVLKIERQKSPKDSEALYQRDVRRLYSALIIRRELAH